MYKHSVLQSVEWGRVRELQGQRTLYAGGALILIKQVGQGFAFGYIPQVDVTQIDWDEVRQAGIAAGLTHIQVDPLNVNTALPTDFWQQKGQKVDKAEAIQLRTTNILEIKNPEVLLENMKKKWRYNIGVAAKHEVQVEITTHPTPAQIETFYSLYADTARRQKYFARSLEYISQVVECLGPADKIVLATASWKGHTLASWILLIEQDTMIYEYGGSVDEHRDKMPTYALVWKLIQWGSQQGYPYFDLGGTGAKLPGVTRFKQGFGGQDVEFAPAVALILKPARYQLFKLLLKARNQLLKLKKLFIRIKK